MFLRPVVQPVVWPAHSRHRGPVGGGGVKALRFANAFTRTPDKVGSDNAVSLPVRSLTSSGTTATATVDSTAGMASGLIVAMSGATGATTAYNGSYVVTILNGTQFSYTFAGTGDVAAAGTVAASVIPSSPMQTRVQTGITSSGTTATITMANTAGISVGDQLLIHGCNEVAYNGLQTVTAVNANVSVTYTMATTASGSPATGTIRMYQASRTAFAAEMPFTLGSDNWTELRAMFQNWMVGNFNNVPGVFGSPTGWTITECSIRIGTTAYAKVRFGGALTRVVAAAEERVVSDALTAADFVDNAGNPVGVSFTRGTTGSVKVKVQAAFNTFMPHRSTGNHPPITPVGFAAWSYNPNTPAIFDAASVYAVGALTTSGSGSNGVTHTNGIRPLCFDVIGRPATATSKVFMACGDSITQNTGDDSNVDNTGTTVANSANGRVGWFLRSMWDTAFSNASARANCNTAIAGNIADMYRVAFMGAAVSYHENLMDLANGTGTP
jgi:hypothetical protein